VSPIAVAHSTPTGAALAAAVVEPYGLGPDARCLLLSRGLNDTYALEADDRQLVLRLYRARWRTRADVLFELDAIRHAAARGVSVASPVPRRDGQWLTVVDAPEGDRLAVLFEHVAGQEWVPAAQREAYVGDYGATAARLHAAWDDFASPHPRFALDLSHLLDGPCAALAPFLHGRPHDAAYLRDLAGFLREAVERAIGGLTWGVCHGDLHGGNAHLGADGGVTLFDFDCGGMGFRAYELAVFRWGIWAWEKEAEQYWQRFLAGYRAHRPVAQPDLDAVPLFVAIRQLWWMGLHAGNADDWGSRRWINDRFVDQQLGRLAGWCARQLPDAPPWLCQR
jgi:Ser/Thr protein kinase RdoA (MazF antagonist)